MALIALLCNVILLSTECLQEQAHEILFHSFDCVPLSSSDGSCTGRKRFLWVAKEVYEVMVSDTHISLLTHFITHFSVHMMFSEKYMLTVLVVAAADVPFAHLQSQANLFEPRKVKDNLLTVVDNGAVITGDNRDVKVSVLNQSYMFIHSY
jgi:hypothetical protein